MDREDLRSEIRYLLKDTNASDPRWSNTVLNDRINRVQNEMATLTNMLESRVTTNLVSGTAEYDLPNYFLRMKSESSVLIIPNGDTVYKSITMITENELNLNDADWRDTKGTPTNFYLRRQKIGLYPYPDYAMTNGLRMDFNRLCDDMDEDTDIPFNGEYRFYPQHFGIVFGVCRLCKIEDNDWGNADKFEEKYAVMLKEIRSVVNAARANSRIPNIYEFVRHNPRRTR